jgi:hypothetical protein
MSSINNRDEPSKQITGSSSTSSSYSSDTGGEKARLTSGALSRRRHDDLEETLQITEEIRSMTLAM